MRQCPLRRLAKATRLRELKEKITPGAREPGLTVPAGPLPYYPLGNLYGINIEQVAVLISRLTFWTGQRQVLDRYGTAEAPLPLVDLSTVRRADDLAVEWPRSMSSPTIRLSAVRNTSAKPLAVDTRHGSAIDSASGTGILVSVGSGKHTTISTPVNGPGSSERT